MFSEFVNKLSPYCKDQVMSNIIREWCKLADLTSPTRVFSVNRYLKSQTIPRNLLDQNDIETAAKFSDSISQWIGKRSSFGVIHQYNVQSNDGEISEWNQLSSNQLCRNISLILFCPKEETYQLQQMLTRIRNHWYKKLSRSPLNSGFRSILNEQNSTVNIMYHPKQIVTRDDVQLDEIILNEVAKQNNGGHQHVDKYDIIICRTNLNNCMMAFLDDAFMVANDNRIVLKLNNTLAPFKLAITFEGNEDQSRLTEVADYLITNLREFSDITIFPFVSNNLINIDDADKLAIQYCIILKEETLKNGIIWLRNRDTQISEMVHISNFIKTILFYLQPATLFNTMDEESRKKDVSTDSTKN
ncbi:hypothetical protein BLOT_014567 [Blomia tropicalis]|nr:hypothetical protein BLOT_014567 [Blomia tropicalis]